MATGPRTRRCSKRRSSICWLDGQPTSRNPSDHIRSILVSGARLGQGPVAASYAHCGHCIEASARASLGGRRIFGGAAPGSVVTPSRFQPLVRKPVGADLQNFTSMWRSIGGSIGSQGSQTIGQISGARCQDVGKDRDPTQVAGVHVGVVPHQQIDHLGSVRQCAVQTVQRRPTAFVACVRQAWIVRQQRANPVEAIAADRVMDPGAIYQLRRIRSRGRWPHAPSY